MYLKLKFLLPKKIAVRIPNCSLALKILNTLKKPIAVAKCYATGKIPAGFFKREGKLSEREILASRVS